MVEEGTRDTIDLPQSFLGSTCRFKAIERNARFVRVKRDGTKRIEQAEGGDSDLLR